MTWSRTAISVAMGMLVAGTAPGTAGAQTSASHKLTIHVLPFNRAVFTPSPVLAEGMSGAVAAAGSFRFVTTEHGQKVVVDLDKPLPAGATLSLRMSASGTTAPTIETAVSTSPMDLVTDIQPAHEMTLPLATIIGTTRARGGHFERRRLTYTIIAGA